MISSSGSRTSTAIPEIVPTPTPEMRPQGKPGRMVKVDETTVRWEFDVPYFLFEDIMAGDTAMGGGQAVRQANKVSFGAYAPGALPQAVPAEVLLRRGGERARQAGGVRELGADAALQEGLGTQPRGTGSRTVAQRAADQQRRSGCWSATRTTTRSIRPGISCPISTSVQFTLAENLEVINLRAMAGEYDEQERHIDLGKLPVLLDNQEKGNYKVHLDLGFAGSDFMFHVNQSYTGDPEVRKWLTNADFRRALALGYRP